MILEDEGFVEGPAGDPIPSSPPSSIHSQDAAPTSRMSRQGRMPFQTGVDVMVSRFMVRGQHGPVGLQSLTVSSKSQPCSLTTMLSRPKHNYFSMELKLYSKTLDA